MSEYLLFVAWVISMTGMAVILLPYVLPVWAPRTFLPPRVDASGIMFSAWIAASLCTAGGSLMGLIGEPWAVYCLIIVVGWGNWAVSLFLFMDDRDFDRRLAELDPPGLLRVRRTSQLFCATCCVDEGGQHQEWCDYAGTVGSSRRLVDEQ